MSGRASLILRDYQTDAIKSLFDAWTSDMNRPAVVLPTGSGKTVIFSHLVQHFRDWRTACDGNPVDRHGNRVMILVHRDELADQAIKKLRDIAPHLAIGKVKADSNEIHADVMVCSVQTISRAKRLDQLVFAQLTAGNIGLIITDECHHAAAESYRKIFAEFPDARHSGFTATLERGDGVGLGSVWDDVVFSRSVLWMISRGHLVDVRGVQVDLERLDLSKVRKSGGDYQAAALGTAMIEAGSPDMVARVMREYASGRRSIVFCPDVASAVATARAIGAGAAVVHGKTSREDRQLIYKRFETGELTTLVNCMVLAEGFDAPWADCVVIARPTKSAQLYMQMVGRGLRPWPGKSDALVLNIAGANGTISTLIDLAPGEVSSMRHGESLAEAAIRTETELNTVIPADSLAFALKHRDIDLFASSSQAWLRSEGGVMFIPVGSSFVFLWAADGGTWDVCFAPPRGDWKRLHRSLPLGTAMAWAETEAEDRAQFNNHKNASWRRSPAFGPQVGRAHRYGYKVPENPTKGQVSDLISIGEATAKFDEHMKRVKV